jgi:hypothetical protein
MNHLRKKRKRLKRSLNLKVLEEWTLMKKNSMKSSKD